MSATAASDPAVSDKNGGGIRAAVFDAYGTLLDVHAAMQRRADRLPPDWERISAQAAAAFGVRVFWCNRKAQADEYGLGGMATVIPGLAALPDLLQ